MSNGSVKLYETLSKSKNEDSPQKECSNYVSSNAVNAPFEDEPIPDSVYMQLYGASAAAQVCNEVKDD
ncbi:MAG: hypothetical protein KIC97_06170 [Firmicutes bacterium]|nr:hypothetical protein [Bacillota bacterium]